MKKELWIKKIKFEPQKLIVRLFNKINKKFDFI